MVFDLTEIILLMIGILLALFIIIYIRYLIAKEFQRFAADKGYTENRYFWWCFFLLGIGALMVLVMPNKNAIKSNSWSNSGNVSFPAGNYSSSADDQLPDI